MVLDYKKDMYQNTDTLYIEKVINSTKKILQGYEELSNRELYEITNVLFDIKLSEEEKDYLKKECINLYDYVSSDIRENYDKYSYFYNVNFVLHTLELNLLFSHDLTKRDSRIKLRNLTNRMRHIN